MAKQITTTVYTYAELLELHATGEVSSTALENAKQWLRQANTDHEWWEFSFEDWKECLSQIGFENAEISFSGFSSQGDGASFTASVNFEKLLAFFTTPIEPADCVMDGEPGGWLPYVIHKLGYQQTNRRYEWLKLIVDSLSGSVKRTEHRYSHEMTCSFEMDFYSHKSRPEVENVVGEFEVDVAELRYKLCRVIYRALESEYEYLTSDEAIADFAEANEYTFTILGKRAG